MKNTEPRCAERDERTMNQRAREKLRTLNCKGSKGETRERLCIENTESQNAKRDPMAINQRALNQ
jgi:hypothetical protein